MESRLQINKNNKIVVKLYGTGLADNCFRFFVLNSMENQEKEDIFAVNALIRCIVSKISILFFIYLKYRHEYEGFER